MSARLRTKDLAEIFRLLQLLGTGLLLRESCLLYSTKEFADPAGFSQQLLKWRRSTRSSTPQLPQLYYPSKSLSTAVTTPTMVARAAAEDGSQMSSSTLLLRRDFISALRILTHLEARISLDHAKPSVQRERSF